MRKTILIIALILAGCVNVQAQLIKFGLKAGLNYANLTDSEIQTDAITGYHAGFLAEFKVLDKFALQPEILYSTQGATYKTTSADIKNELGYLALPVMMKIYFSDKFSLELGPQASFLLNERGKFNPTDSNTFDFSVAAGLGLKITKSIFIQGRYGLGLTEVSKDAQTKNSVLQFSAGLLF